MSCLGLLIPDNGNTMGAGDADGWLVKSSPSYCSNMPLHYKDRVTEVIIMTSILKLASSIRAGNKEPTATLRCTWKAQYYYCNTVIYQFHRGFRHSTRVFSRYSRYDWDWFCIWTFLKGVNPWRETDSKPKKKSFTFLQPGLSCQSHSSDEWNLELVNWWDKLLWFWERFFISIMYHRLQNGLLWCAKELPSFVIPSFSFASLHCAELILSNASL